MIVASFSHFNPEEIRFLIQIAGPSLTLAGIILSMWGTYITTKWSHPLKGRGFTVIALRITGLVLTGRLKQAEHEALLLAKLAVNREIKAKILVGLCIVFVGFVAQGVGTLFWGADAVWGMVGKK